MGSWLCLLMGGCVALAHTQEHGWGNPSPGSWWGSGSWPFCSFAWLPPVLELPRFAVLDLLRLGYDMARHKFFGIYLGFEFLGAGFVSVTNSGKSLPTI